MIEQQHGSVRYLQFSHYSQFVGLTHGVFMRHGGCSQTPYESLNMLGRLVGGDKREHVIRNRQIVLETLHLQNTPCASVWCIHSAEVAVFSHGQPWRTDWAQPSFYDQPWLPEYIHKADALITPERGVALALSFADCTPVLLYDAVQHVVGIAHCGWRGTARGILFATIEAMGQHFGSQPQDIYAGIGPTIGPCCYEVSETVRRLFLGCLSFDDLPTHSAYRSGVRESAVFVPVPLADRVSLRLDLFATNRNQLIMAGLAPEHVETTQVCTCCHKQDFFSHRGEQGSTGRFATIIALL